MNKKSGIKYATVLILIVSGLLLKNFDNNGTKSTALPDTVNNKTINMEKHKVTRVVDGDTFVIENKEKVRLIGVDTPETVKPNTAVQYYGKEASDFSKKLLAGNYVYLEKDISNTDKYGRLLRYIYLEDGTFFNELIIKEGYAKVSTYPPDVKYVDVFIQAERFARENNKGLWKQ